MAVTDKNCIHAEVCQYAGTAFESCEKCKFRKHSAIDTDKTTEEVVGVCIEHEWAEEHEGVLISNFECPFCGEWHRDVGTYCYNCGKLIKIVYKERK